MSGRFRSRYVQSLVLSLISGIVGGLIAMPTGGAAAVITPILYVDRDARCPGIGTDGSPYCRIQNAFDHVNCGQRIHIRQPESKTPYDENAVARSPSCSASTRIVVEPAPRHMPILRSRGRGAEAGAIQLQDVDFWTVQGLIFDGEGVATSDSAIEVSATMRSIRGVEILNNIIRNWGLVPLANRGVRALYVHGNPQEGFTANDVVVRGNTFRGIRTNAMRIEGTQRAIIEHNSLSQLKCGWQSAESLKHEAIKITTGQTRSRSPSNGTLIRHNHIYDFQTMQACRAEYGVAASRATFRGIYCDVNADDGQVVGNRIHNMSPAITSANLTRAIYIESRCDRWVVSENIVYDVAGVCFRISAAGTSVELTHNVCYNAGLGIDYRGHDNVTITDNIIFLTRPKARVMRLDQEAINAPHVVDRNLYIHPNYRLRFQHGSNKVALREWKRVCQCDANSLQSDPKFIDALSAQKNFHLDRNSPARGAGTNGTAIGAYPLAP